MYKEEGEAIEKFESKFADIEFENETGLPAVARKYGPANGGMPGVDEPFIPHGM
jgi:hypothetical protein